MNVLQVTMHNFGSFWGEHTARLMGSGLTFVQGENLDEPKMESNGAGKSTTFDAIDWALFGRTPKGDKADSVINEEAGSKCWVEVELTEGAEGWVVRRYRKMPEGNGVRLLYRPPDGPEENLTAMDSKETDARIAQVVGMDRDIFLAAVYRQQGDSFNFAEATDTERKRMLSRIVPELEECDRLLVLAKQKRDASLQKFQALAARISQVHTAIESHNATDLGQMEQAWLANRDQRLRQAIAAHHQIHQLLTETQQAQGLRQGLQDQLQRLVQPEQQGTWAAELQARQDAFRALQNATQQAKVRMHDAEDRLQKVQRLPTGDCSECGQPITGEHLQKEVESMTRKRDYWQSDWARHQANEDHFANGPLAEAQRYAAQETEYNRQVWGAYQAERSRLEAELASLPSKNITMLQKQVDDAAAMVRQIQAETWVAPESPVQKLIEESTGLQLELDQEQAVLQHWEWWVEALGNKGVKSYILDSKVEAMTEAANAWVSALTGGTTWVRFETQTMTSAGKLNEAFNVRIFRHNPDGTTTERSYRSWSGGEKKRVALGIDQGLAQLVASRASKSWGLYILDESFRQHIDSGGREAVFELLQSLDRDAVFVIDHDAEMAGQFENKLRVRIQNRRSRFVVE